MAARGKLKLPPHSPEWRCVECGESWRHPSGAWIDRIGSGAVYRLGQAEARIAESLELAFGICEHWAKSVTGKRPGRASGAGP